MADVAPATTADSGVKRVEKPDEAKFKAELAEREKAHKAAQADFNAIRGKLDGARPGKGGQQGDRWSQLVDQQKEIRAKQGANKTSVTAQKNKLDANDREIKNLLAQQKEARTRIGFNNAKEVEAKIESLMKQVDSGQMKLVDEKKTLTEVSNLRRSLKNFQGIDGLQSNIDARKAENAELKKTLDNAENKALSEQYTANQKELDALKAAREDVNKNFDKLKSQREAAYTKQNDAWKAMQELKDSFYAQRKAYKEYEDHIYEQRRQRQKAERDQYEKERRKKVAESRLEEASAPAFGEEILTAENIIRHFDPAYGAAAGDKGPGKFAASSQRTVDESGFKGMSVMKKEEEDFFVGGGGKKKGKKGGKTAPDNKFNLSIDLIEGLGRLGVDPPSSQADVPPTIEKLKQKVEQWKKDQKSQTEKNIEKAQKEIEKLEQEADAAVTAPPPKRAPRQDRGKKVNQKEAGIDNEGREVNVDAEAVQDAEKDAANDAAKELEAAKIEDAQS